MLKWSSSALRTWVVMGVGSLVLALSAFFVLSNISPDSTFAQEDGTIKYKEYTMGADPADSADDTGTGPVRLFTSTDPEGADVIWDVTGPDADDFMIDNGVLSFKTPPNYEDPTTRAAYDVNGNGDATETGEAAGDHNFYQMTIRASEVRDSGVTGRALSSETDVVVEVENVDEPGTVEMNWLRPEVDVAITATLDDPDTIVLLTGTVGTGDDAVTLGWTWERSSVSDPDPKVNGHWVSAAGAAPDNTENRSAYTPIAADFSSVTPRFFRAVARYTDAQSDTDAKRASGASAMAVREAPAPGENGSPDFNTETRTNGGYVRTISEAAAVGADVGNPVRATDPDTEDTLTYQLDSDSDNTNTPAADADVHSFSIDKVTGQIMVEKALDADSVTGRRTGATVGEYEVYVTATDPSGLRGFVKVVITVTVANDAPKIWDGSDTADNVAAPSELSVNEQNSDDLHNNDDTTDMTPDGKPDTPYVHLTGNQYRATDEDTVDDIKWTLEGTDSALFKHTETGGVITVQFKNPPNFEDPGDADVDNVYKVTLKATDNGGLYAERPISIMVNNVKETGELTFDKTQPFVGQMIAASVSDQDNGVAPITWQWFRADRADGMNDDSDDADTDPDEPTMIMGATSATYTPVAADRTKFLKAVATYIDSWSHPDNSTTPDFDERVQSDASTARVPTDEDDPADTDTTVTGGHRVYMVAKVTANAVKVEGEDSTTDPTAPPEFSSAAYTRMVAENARVGDYVGAPVKADKDATYSLSSSSGDDANFIIDNYGQIRVKDIDANTDGNQRPDLDYEDKSSYSVTVTATDDGDRTDTAPVTIELINLNEMPYLTAASRAPDKTIVGFPENRTSAVETYQAMEPDGASVNWSVKGPDAALFSISNGALMFIDAPDFETFKDVVAHPAIDLNGDGDTDDTSVTNDINDDGDTDDPGESVSEVAQTASNGVYMVTVVATETSTASGPKKSDEVNVAVTVTDVDEPGVGEINWLQPEVGTELTFSATDDDADPTNVVVTGARWYRSKTDRPQSNPSFTFNTTGSVWEHSEWTLLTPTGATYTPVATVGDSDVGRFLLALVSYDDDTGDATGANADVAIGMSRYVVRADVLADDNSSPEFNHAGTTRSVSESAAVGATVGNPLNRDISGSTLDTGEYLTYTLEAADSPNDADLDFFDIDKATGQISLKKKVSAEATDGRTYDDSTPANNATAGEYKVMVRVTDPSNTLKADTSRKDTDTIAVTITAENVNEAPKITAGGLELMVAEKDSSKESTEAGYYNSLRDLTPETGNPGNAYTASEDENQTINWRLKSNNADDAAQFQISRITAVDTDLGHTVELDQYRQIVFKAPPDYEDPMDRDKDNVYHVTIEAYDASGKATGREVRIQVTNVDEAGELTLAPDQPVLEDEQGDVGQVMASLMDYDGIMTDPDGVQTITSWAWYWSDNEIDIDREVTFNNSEDPPEPITTGTGAPPHGSVSVLDPSTDTGHHAGENTATYTVMEDDEGKFLHARVTYRDGASIEDHPATGADERDTTTDDINTLATEPNDNIEIARTKNAVAPTAADGTTPGDDNEAPMFESSAIRIEVPENTPSTGYVGLPITATDEDLTDEDDNTNLTYELTGANTNRFALAPDTDNDDAYYNSTVMRNTGDGQIAVKPVTHLDHEAQKNTFDVELSATDSAGLKGTTTVTIVVTGVNEAPSTPMGFAGALIVTGPQVKSYYEVIDPAATTWDAVQTYKAQGQDADSATWSHSGTDAADFTITGGVLAFVAAPNYEMPMDDDMDNVYQVTITAMAGANTYNHAVTVTVMNVDDMGRVTFWRDDAQGVGQDATDAAIMVGDVLTALAEDPDGNVGDMPPMADMYPDISGATWQWAKTMTPDMMDSWMDIDRATNAEYTVEMADSAYVLRARAMYEDAHGAGKMAYEMTEGAVGATLVDDVLDRYDADDNGTIEKLEYLEALDHYIAGDPDNNDQRISKETYLEVLDLYITALQN